MNNTYIQTVVVSLFFLAAGDRCVQAMSNQIFLQPLDFREIVDGDEIQRRACTITFLRPSIDVYRGIVSDCYKESFLVWFYTYYFAHEFIVSCGDLDVANLIELGPLGTPVFDYENFKQWIAKSLYNREYFWQLQRSLSPGIPFSIHSGDVEIVYTANLRYPDGGDLLSRRMLRVDSLEELYASMTRILNPSMSCVELTKTQKERDKLLRKSAFRIIQKVNAFRFVIVLNLGTFEEHYDVAIGIRSVMYGKKIKYEFFVWDTQGRVSDELYCHIIKSLHIFLEQLRMPKAMEAAQLVHAPCLTMLSDNYELLRPVSLDNKLQSPVSVDSVSKRSFDSCESQARSIDSFGEKSGAYLANYKNDIANLARRYLLIKNIGTAHLQEKVYKELACIYDEMVVVYGDKAEGFFIETAGSFGFSVFDCDTIVAVQELVNLGRRPFYINV